MTGPQSWLDDPAVKGRAVQAYLDGVNFKILAAMFEVSIGTIERFLRMMRADPAMAGARRKAKVVKAAKVGKASALATRVYIQTADQLKQAAAKLAKAVTAEGGHANMTGLIMQVRGMYPGLCDLAQDDVAYRLYLRAKDIPLPPVLELPKVSVVRTVVAQVAAKHRITPDLIMGRSRKQYIIEARQEVMWVLRQPPTAWSYTRISRALGLKDHTTVIHGVAAHAKRCAQEQWPVYPTTGPLGTYDAECER